MSICNNDMFSVLNQKNFFYSKNFFYLKYILDLWSTSMPSLKSQKPLEVGKRAVRSFFKTYQAYKRTLRYNLRLT